MRAATTWRQHAHLHVPRCTSASKRSACCRGSATRSLGTRVNATNSSSSTSVALPFLRMHETLRCSTTLRRNEEPALKLMPDFKRRCASSTSRAHHELGEGTTPLDVAVLDAASCSSLDAVLAKHGLVLRWTMSLMPEHFLAQALRPSVAAIYVYPSSAPLHAAHRRVGARTQSRVEIPPGGCLLRGEASRREWTLALPPLLLTRSNAAPTAACAGHADTVRLWSERTRKIAVLADLGRDLGADDESFELEVHRPRRPVE